MKYLLPLLPLVDQLSIQPDTGVFQVRIRRPMKRLLNLLCLLVTCGTVSFTGTPNSVPFAMPLDIGTTWYYSYTYQSNKKSFEYTTIRGVRTWRVVSAALTSWPHVYGVIVVREDSVSRSWITNSGSWADTTYVLRDSIPMSVTSAMDSILVSWGATMRIRPSGPGSEIVESVPQVVNSVTDTLRRPFGSGYPSGTASYLPGKGLVLYKASLPVMSLSSSEECRLVAVVSPGPTHIVEETGANGLIPAGIRLEQNFPNPFNPSTTIRLHLTYASQITVEVCNMLGQVVYRKTYAQMPAGSNDIVFVASDLSSGPYYFRLKCDHGIASGRMLLAK